jgi:hypothetical protein
VFCTEALRGGAVDELDAALTKIWSILDDG